MNCIKLILHYQILLYSGEKCHSLKILKVAIEDQPVGRQQTVEWCSQFKNDVTSVKDARLEGQETVAFHNHAPPHPPKKKKESEKSLSMKLLTCWELHLGKFSAL